MLAAHGLAKRLVCQCVTDLGLEGGRGNTLADESCPFSLDAVAQCLL